MVTTRRTPVTPAVPASRVNSTQTLPRAKGKAPQTAEDAAEEYLRSLEEEEESNARSEAKAGSNSDGGSPGKKGKGKFKQKKGGKKRKSKTSFLDLLTHTFILCFTIYTLSVCPSDEKLASPVCRGLANYRRLVLEPYVFPQFQRVLDHPSISPYVVTSKKYIDSAVTTATPVLIRTNAEWNARVVPQWNKRVVPQWNKRVIPQWNKHVVPHIQRVESELEPYRLRIAQEYVERISPSLQFASNKLQLLQVKAQPYVSLAASKTYGGYQIAKPYAIPLWQRVKLVIKQLLLVLQAQRRQFVDPHVARIWEKVVELGSGKPKASSTTSATPPPPQAPVDDTIVPIAADTPAPVLDTEALSSSSSGVPEPQATSSSAFASAPTTLQAITETTVASASTVLPDVIEPTSSTVLPSGALAETVEAVVSSVSSLASEAIETASSAVSSVTDEASSTVLAVTGPSSTPPAVPSAAAHDEEIDLEQFYADLGLDESESDDSEPPPPPPQQVETDEEKKARLEAEAIATAEKRAEITSRHTKWEEDLAAFVKTKKKELRKNLVAMRKTAAAELKVNPEIRAAVETLAGDGEKFIKGAEKYLERAKKTKTDGQKDLDDVEVWHRVITKVEARFEDRVQSVTEAVDSWYAGHRDQEMRTVQGLTVEVREFASAAQADLGMDYAWLEDVTTIDWARYHELMDQSTDYTNQALAIQNGSHPSPPINPVLRVVDDLESEVQDIVVGFETRLRRLKRNGATVYGVSPPDDVDEDEDAPEPEFSVLPAPPEDPKKVAELKDIPPVILGRGQAEVLEALGKVEEPAATESAQPRSEQKDTEKTVEADPSEHVEL
ncbi:hypothetical protein PLICRDRAFT_42929 [Plicaturopsis crispa FD-325 SS-3]|nr:hypothetical protein PLICRDRAFT_42929 [Plicaturopsis crispa FD-325 SS-3]